MGILRTVLLPVLRDVFRGPFDGLGAVAWVYPTDIPAAEAEALRTLYEDGGGPGWTSSGGWGTGNAADYYGITVTTGHVTAIELSNNNVVMNAAGAATLDFSDLTQLSTFDLSDNSIDSDTVDALLVSVNNGAGSSGFLDLSGNSEPDYGTEGSPSLAAMAVNAALLRDWTITLDGTIPTWVQPVISSRYWRWRATAPNHRAPLNTYNMGLRDIQLRTTETGSNLISIVTADASSEYSATYSAEKAFDGDTTSRWNTVATPTEYQWVSVDAGSVISPAWCTVWAYEEGNGAAVAQTLLIETASSLSGPWTVARTISPVNSAGSQVFNIQSVL